MPKFTVMCLKDAFVEYSTEVEAEDAREARQIAKDYRYKGEWQRGGVREYDDTVYPLEEVEEVEEVEEETTDPENIYGLDSVRQSIEEDRK